MDAITLEGLGAEALGQGIRFLYAQSEDLLSRWRSGGEERSEPPAWVDGAADAVSQSLGPLSVDQEALVRLAEDLDILSSALGPYLDTRLSGKSVSPNLLSVVEGLRRSLEAITGQVLTFQGESVDRTATTVELRLDEVAGYVVGVKAKALGQGGIRVVVDAGPVERGGRVTGLELD